MYPLAVSAFLVAVLSVSYAFLPDIHVMQRTSSQEGVAMNFCVYRDAVSRFIREGTPPAVVPNASLDLPPGYQFLRQWRARIISGYCYIYGEADNEETMLIQQALNNTVLVGKNRNGVLHPSLITVPQSFPDGAVVSIVSVQ